MQIEKQNSRLRPLSHNVYTCNQDFRPQTAQAKHKQGTIYKGNYLTKALSPLSQDALAFQQRIRPITAGGIQYPHSTINKLNQFTNFSQKPRTATTKSQASQATQFGKPKSQAYDKNVFDLNLVESEVYPGVYYAKSNDYKYINQYSQPN